MDTPGHSFVRRFQLNVVSGKSKEEIEEEEQLQLALAISQSEAEAKEQERKKRQTFMSLDATPPGGNPEPVVCMFTTFRSEYCSFDVTF